MGGIRTVPDQLFPWEGFDGLGGVNMVAPRPRLELIFRRYERTSTLLTSDRSVDDPGMLLGDTAGVTALLGRLVHHAHVLKCGPRSCRTRVQERLANTGCHEV